MFYISPQQEGTGINSQEKKISKPVNHPRLETIFKPLKVLLSIMLGRLRDATLERIQEIKQFIQSKGN